jgi:hypothetical protein
MDHVFDAFCRAAAREAETLAAQSDVLAIVPLPPMPPSRFLLRFAIPYLRRRPDSTIEPAPGPILAGIRFPADYLLGTDPHLWMRVVSIETPALIHPNVREGVACLGAQFAPGTPFRVLVRAVYDLLTYQLMTLDEQNALDPEACRALRAAPDLFTHLSAPPLTRRTHRITVNKAGAQ